MNEELNEKMLDLLCQKALYGLTEQETQELERLGYDPADESIEMTVAALSTAGVDSSEQMPEHLQAGIMANAESYFRDQQTAEPIAPAPVRSVALSEARPAAPWFSWLGWAAAAAACIALVFVVLTPRSGIDVVGNPTPTPVVQEKTDPVQRHKELVDSSQQVLRAQIGKGNVKDIEGVTGDIVWSDEKQAGYIRVKGLPKNDPGSATYQLWIFAENQDAKYPADGGTFDINADGEIIIPVDSRVKIKNPSAFAITIEKAGGVVVSDRGKIAAFAKA